MFLRLSKKVGAWLGALVSGDCVGSELVGAFVGSRGGIVGAEYVGALEGPRVGKVVVGYGVPSL